MCFKFCGETPKKYYETPLLLPLYRALSHIMMNSAAATMGADHQPHPHSQVPYDVLLGQCMHQQLFIRQLHQGFRRVPLSRFALAWT